jgi:predicted DNA-binding transcriptional regulator AlpA
MEEIKNGLLAGTAPFTNPAAKAKGPKGQSPKAEAERESQPKAVADESRDKREDSAPHGHHQRYGHRGDNADDDGAPYRVPGRKLLTRHLIERYRVSDRTIDRWIRDPSLGFPRPTVINGRKFWDEAEIDQFDAKRRTAKEAEKEAEARPRGPQGRFETVSTPHSG